MPDRLRITRTEEGRRVVLSLTGELDLGTAPTLEESLAAGPASASVVLDLRELRFMDSTGLRTILAADERLRAAGGELTLIRGPKAVDRVFRITGMGDRLRLLDDEDS